MKNPFNYRLALVGYARQHEIKVAVRAFQTTMPTVRKWRHRYQAEGLAGLQDRSRAPHHCPHKIQGELEQVVVALRKQLPTFGAVRLQREWQLPLSPMAIQRIWHEHDLVKPRRRKYQHKQDLTALKAIWRLGQQISTDTKDLDDIPHYWPQMQARGLPTIRYTAREVRSGLQFLAYAQRRSAGASGLFAHRSQSHLAACGLDLSNLVWQTDNGEFIGAWQPGGSRTGFPAAATCCVLGETVSLISRISSVSSYPGHSFLPCDRDAVRKSQVPFFFSPGVSNASRITATLPSVLAPITSLWNYQERIHADSDVEYGFSACSRPAHMR